MGVKNQELGLWTWAEKCTFADDNITVYCAVPLYLKTGSGIYPQLAQNTPDTIYKINTNSGFKQEIAQPTDSLGIGLYTAQKLMLSTDESILYMVGTNGGLFEIRLK
jgi:hypothetical protein